MKRFLISLLFIVSFYLSYAQIRWDGGGGDGLWSTASNWVGDVVPGAADNVILDNSSLAGSYTVTLPSGAVIVTVNTLQIIPTLPNTITLILPITNTAEPGFSIIGPGDALIINTNGIFQNSSGAAGSPVFAITNTLRINNGGKFLHNTQRAHAAIVSQLSTVAGTENGTFEFDVPGNGAYAVSLTNRNYGNLVLSNTAVSARTYTGNGASDLTIRGNLVINVNGVFNISMTANVLIAGNLTITGNFDHSPSVGGTGRCILLNGTTNQIVSGIGNFTLGTNFRNIEVNAGSSVTLQRGIILSNAGNTFIVNNGGTLQMAANVINGGGTFQLNSGGWVGLGSSEGITTAPTASGNVQTSTRTFQPDASYEYNGAVGITQITGNALPTTISGKLIINTSAGLGTTGVTQTQATTVNGEFVLTNGKYTTGPMPNILYIGNAAVTTAAYIDNSFVNGIMSKYGNTPYKFPVGKGVDMHYVELETTGGNIADIYTVEYFKANPASFCTPGTMAGGVDHISKLEYWAIQCISGFTPSNRITLNATTYTYATDRTRLVITNCTSGNWDNLGNANPLPGAAGPVESSSSIIGGFFNFFTFGSLDPSPVNPLPIDLISFDANKLSTTTSSLNWELAACCSSAAKFEIQRAGANKSFVTIGTIGGSETNKLYNYIDNGLKNGVNYYRLKMIDVDGKVTYSRIVAVMNGVNGLLLTSFIPTVVTNTASLTIASSNRQKLDIVIVDMQGRVVMKHNYTIAEGNTNIELHPGILPAGVYQLTGISAEGKTNTIRFIKQ